MTTSYHWARKPDGEVLHAFPLPLSEDINTPVCGQPFLRRADVSSPQHLNMSRCRRCLHGLQLRGQQR